jgi:plasmid stabilization system protein ParE
MPVEMIFRPLAKREIDEIVAYYEIQKEGLGLMFVNVLDLLLERIEQQPLQFPVRHKNIRIAVLNNFPYVVFFRVYKQQIVVLGVVHQKRNPKIGISRK